MLKISKSIEYAILAIRYIEMNHEKECISAKEIASNANIPKELNAKILQKLVKNDIISSTQGTKGGYKLLKTLENLSISNVIEALGEKIQLTDCLFDEASKVDCQRMENCCIKKPMTIIQDKINSVFDSTYLTEFSN